jgi:hypothetical protein
MLKINDSSAATMLWSTILVLPKLNSSRLVLMNHKQPRTQKKFTVQKQYNDIMS